MSFVDIPVSHGRLEGLWWAAENPRAGSIACHPHPVHGGTMHNHVTYRLAQAWRDASVSCVRFNFRGVGRSSGAYDEGRGEIDDAQAAFSWMAERTPNVPLYASGFSFGSRTALALALREPRIQKLIAVGVAVDMFDVEFVTQIEKPIAFIHSEKDELSSLASLKKLIERVKAPHTLFVVPDADHLCTGKLEEFSACAKQAVAWVMG
jgi:alpha/beta superfamily hydrolase